MNSGENPHIELMAGDLDHLQASYNSTNALSIFPLHSHDHSYEMMLFQAGNIKVTDPHFKWGFDFCPSRA